MKKAKTIAISAFSIIFIVLIIKDMGNIQDLTGKSFKTFTVLKLDGVRKSYGTHNAKFWLCECSKCGHRFISKTSLINSGSAGCWPCSVEAKKTHGMWTSKEYKSWQGMKSRCHNPKDDHYKDYGARGITVCNRWINSFENFYSDMGPRLRGMTLDRKDVNGNYEPINCRWATSKQQANNRRNTRLVEFRGQTKSIAEWIVISGLKGCAVYRRIERGWSVEDALTKPIMYGNLPIS